MDNLYFNIGGFAICTALILISGSRLSKYGDMMADLMGWGKMFMGLILMAFVTSMPELMSGFSSIVIIGAPNLAVGDIVGSCAFNILIISIMDLFYDDKKPLTSMINPAHIIAATFSIIMLTVVAMAILIPGVFGRFLWIGGSSLVFIFLYLFSIRVLFLYERKQPHFDVQEKSHSLTKRQVIIKYAINAFFVMAAAMALPFFGEHIASASGLGNSFFGTLFLAASTSLPEIVVSVAAIRLGTVDMAIGNIFGSNIFNIGILAMDDILHSKGPLLLDTSHNHIIPVLGTIIITAIGITGIVYKSDMKWKLAIDTAAIVIVFILMMVILFYKIKNPIQ